MRCRRTMTGHRVGSDVSQRHVSKNIHCVHLGFVQNMIMSLELPLAVSRPAIVLFTSAIVIFCLVKSRLISKLLDIICASDAYKKWFANFMKKIAPSINKGDANIMDHHKAQYKKIGDKVLEIGGDVLEIGAGTGTHLQTLRLPEGSSLTVVDYNPFMEKHFRESLAKAPHIELKDYLVQSAADMSNIPDNTFAVVFTTDVMCSLEIEDLRKMLKEIKRVLKPDGCLFFIEHVLDVPGTWRRTFQKLISSQTGIWPRLTGNCHCDRETLKYIQEVGFRSVTFNYTYLPLDNMPTYLIKLIMCIVRRFMIGHARK